MSLLEEAVRLDLLVEGACADMQPMSHEAAGVLAAGIACSPPHPDSMIAEQVSKRGCSRSRDDIFTEEEVDGQDACYYRPPSKVYGHHKQPRGSSGEYDAARYLRGEEKAKPWVAGGTSMGQEWMMVAQHSVSLEAPKEGRCWATFRVPGLPRKLVSAAGKDKGQFLAPQHPPAPAEQRHAGLHKYMDEQPGPSGLSMMKLSGHMVLDYDEESLEEG
ncbi:hypothetical protein NDU88_003584 [Pleurodeles waltl]|uniref:Uncharacterized protein n=1 Tax=Pleurodeles waltl TaxID=8319 RepID=A0AAV7MBH5_PLEWA|nr:hypothetical protein NDU88_003584 [Pleurodeles waltl]